MQFNEQQKQELLHIIAEYKKLIIKREGNAPEIYKWELLNVMPSKWDLDAEDFKGMLGQLKFNNLIYHTAKTVLMHIASEKPEDLRSAFKGLFEDKDDLQKRIETFKQSVRSIYSLITEAKWHDKHQQDERTIATYLTFFNPNQYTLYKWSFVSLLYKKLGLPANKNYSYYLNLVKSFVNEFVLTDKELLNIADSYLSEKCFKDSNRLILAQDIFYQFFLEDKTNDVRYWRIGASDGNGESFFEEMFAANHVSIGWGYIGDAKAFGKDRHKIAAAIQKGGYSPDNNALASKKANEVLSFVWEIKIGDIIIVANGQSVLGIAEVIDDYEYNDQSTFSHIKKVNWIDIYPKGLPIIKSGLRTSVKEIIDNEEIEKIQFVITNKDIQSPSSVVSTFSHEIQNNKDRDLMGLYASTSALNTGNSPVSELIITDEIIKFIEVTLINHGVPISESSVLKTTPIKKYISAMFPVLKITTFSISNFKAFKEPEIFDIDSKNLLIFGVNGSGKTSFSQALHYFFQSSTWDENRLQELLSSDNEEKILHIEKEDKPQDFKIGIKLSNDKEYEIKNAGSNTTKTEDDSIIQNAFFASDWMNYNLLFQFYHFRRKENTNVFSIFENEFFPFWTDVTSGQEYEKLYTHLRKKANDLEDQSFKDNSARKLAKKEFKQSIDNFNVMFNTKLSELIMPINRRLSTLLEGDKIDVLLNYNIQLDFLSPDSFLLNEPCIELTIKQNKIPIKRPHLFLNEARLAALALSIRLAAFDQRIKDTPLKLLVLDDLLISLDMSNRMKVFSLFLFDRQFADYQKIILTHDKSLYDFLKKNITTHSSDGNGWKFYEFYENKSKGNPIIKGGKNYIEKAEDAYAAQEWESCALYLRKRAEELIHIYFNPDMENIAKYTVLENLANSLKESLIQEKFKEKIQDEFERIISVKDMRNAPKQDEKQYNPEFNEDELKLALGKAFEKPEEMEQSKFEKLKLLQESILSFISLHHQEKAAKENQLKKLLQVTKYVDELRSRLLNIGAHYNSDIPIFEYELRGAIEKLKDFEKEIVKMKKES